MTFKFNNLYPLFRDMKLHNIYMEQFSFTIKNTQFDCILDISISPFELMVGAVHHSFACIIKIEKGFNAATLTNAEYYELLRILNLSPSKDAFSSFKFFRIIDSSFPQRSQKKTVDPTSIARYRKHKLSENERQEGFVFCGWLSHDGRNNGHARNFQKTELLLGKNIADFCREHDISSKWTTDPSKKQTISFPSQGNSQK